MVDCRGIRLLLLRRAVHDTFMPSVTPDVVVKKPQLHWASLLAARWRVYNLLVNSPSVIIPASKVAACKKATSKVERVQLFIATRWLIRVFASKLSKCNQN